MGKACGKHWTDKKSFQGSGSNLRKQRGNYEDTLVDGKRVLNGFNRNKMGCRTLSSSDSGN